MKRYLYLLAPVVLVLLVWGMLQATPPRPVAAHPTNITMMAPTVQVPVEIGNPVELALSLDSARTGVTTFAITNIAQQGGYWYVSVVGLPDMLPGQMWNIDEAIWLGNVLVKDDQTPAMVVDVPNDSTVNAVTPLGVDPQQQSQSPAVTEYGGGGNFLPFRSGTTAQYGTLGVHDCGFSLNGWKAVDLFPSENMVYTTLAGEVNYVCRDNTQVALRIGNNLYDHLQDNGQQVGDTYGQGAPLAPLVPGTFSAPCGYADQQPDHYHVHFCFVPNPAGAWAADGYAINVNNGNWVKGNDTVAPGGILTANWTSANGEYIPSPTGGANFWDYAAGGVTLAVSKILPNFPTHQAMGIADKIIAVIRPPLDLSYTLILVNFDMTITLWVFGIIIALEAVRLVYAAYMWVKRAIPIIG